MWSLHEVPSVRVVIGARNVSEACLYDSSVVGAIACALSRAMFPLRRCWSSLSTIAAVPRRVRKCAQPDLELLRAGCRINHACLHRLAHGLGDGRCRQYRGQSLYGIDQAFNASGGIGVNETSTAVSALTLWTLSGWYKPTVPPAIAWLPVRLFFKRRAITDSSSGFSVCANNGDNLRVGVSPAMISTTSNSFDPTNEWIFFAVTV